MKNTAETRLPGEQESGRAEAGETRLPKERDRAADHSPLLSPGIIIDDGYVIEKEMGRGSKRQGEPWETGTQGAFGGSQSRLYLAKRWGKAYVVKLYHAGWHPSAGVQSFLKRVEHPNIVRILESGEYRGQCYEIYEYYSEGTLEQEGRVAESHIRKRIVPSVNEGLHELHRNGIIHRDIKPANLFWGKNREKVIIGDCGISSYENAQGKLIDDLCGTPEYAPRVMAVPGERGAVISPAYDYGSLGLVVYRLAAGRSLFAGLSPGEIAGIWEKWGREEIALPDAVGERLAALIKGLLAEDPDRKWGYVQVAKWCQGEYIAPLNRRVLQQLQEKPRTVPFLFGIVNGERIVVESLHRLAAESRKHWEQARLNIKKGALYTFVGQFDGEGRSLAREIRALGRVQNPDEAVYRMLLLIDGEYPGIAYCGREYASAEEYVESLAAGEDPAAEEFFRAGFLLQYFRKMQVDQLLVDELEESIRKYRSDGMAGEPDLDRMAVRMICMEILNTRGIRIHGKYVDSLDQFVSALTPLTVGEISDLLEREDVGAWFSRKGYQQEIKKMWEL